MARAQRSIPLPVIAASGGCRSGGGQARGQRSGGRGTPVNEVRKSRSGPRRAIVLGIVQLLMIAHVVQWLITGTTLTPVEPSESMEAVKNGVINAGAILFAAALASTAILGRWFCGWGCHVVMLQDACAWLLGKAGIRPRPFRSRLLLWVPLLMALYMFVWPVAYRLAIAPFVQPELRWPGWTWHLVTGDFWATFPGWLMGVPFLAICGFLTVYFLGMKGYCTYGCPYGGFFAPLDEVAPARIRVTDACEHCGHCTAVCTSNVRVHEEVAAYGMVVDSGCMKCMDCVSVCPKDALYFGFGASNALTARSGAATASRAGDSAGEGAEQGGLGAKGLAAPRARQDLTWPQEIALAALAAAVFMSVYFPFGTSPARATVPLLFASGITACVAFMVWTSWRTLTAPNASFHRIALVRSGRIARGGWGWLAVTALALAAVVHAAAINVIGWRAERADMAITVPDERIVSADRVELPAQMRAEAERALRLYALAGPVEGGGLGIYPGRERMIALRRARLLAALGDFPAAESVVRGLWDERPEEPVAAALVRLLAAQGRDAEGEALADAAVRDHPTWWRLAEERITGLLRVGRTDEAIAMARARHAAVPDELLGMRRLSMVLIEHGNSPDEVEEGVRLVDRTIEIDPRNPNAWRVRAMGLVRLERREDAIAAVKRALELAPGDPGLEEALRALSAP
ncbi:MAG: 4Fe-4S binding protein [Phycisphaerales bacterium]|nr:4Fe-4S binding protein [Phycisphaerales bacterium]